MDDAFGVISKKSSPNLRSFGFFPISSSRSFTVLHLTFRSVIIFVKTIRSVSRFFSFSFLFFFFFLHVDVQLFQHHLLKRLFLLYYIAFATLSKIR